MAQQITAGEWESTGLTIRVHGRGTIAVCPTPQNGGTTECSTNADAITALPAMVRALTELAEQGSEIAADALELAGLRDKD